MSGWDLPRRGWAVIGPIDAVDGKWHANEYHIRSDGTRISPTGESLGPFDTEADLQAEMLKKGVSYNDIV